ncbi:hypothetical protein [Candidatus Marimicrobium litorale]|uniref:Uncharacterized protein n=1 Tax=Candidatus Marimicrobium litorale TaxID=2518991 RepID=A0ABT3TAF3_9GAMM|nr:hypothetical protein [Candidatus Marimicrobium litorale]MCX2979225.1 hypothetical protein [Candidatus Marimicrobium litorale]
MRFRLTVFEDLARGRRDRFIVLQDSPSVVPLHKPMDIGVLGLYFKRSLAAEGRWSILARCTAQVIMGKE